MIDAALWSICYCCYFSLFLWSPKLLLIFIGDFHHRRLILNPARYHRLFLAICYTLETSSLFKFVIMLGNCLFLRFCTALVKVSAILSAESVRNYLVSPLLLLSYKVGDTTSPAAAVAAYLSWWSSKSCCLLSL